MGKAWAATVGILDAFPFAVGLVVVLLSVGDAFDRGQLLMISVLLGVGIGALLAVISASRYAADGTRFWLVRTFLDAPFGLWP